MDRNLAGHHFLTLSTGLSDYLDSGEPFLGGEWRHVAATYDGATARFFIDGQEMASKPFTGNVGDSDDWRIGAYGQPPTSFFDGSIGEVRVYDYAGTDQAIAADADTPVGDQPPVISGVSASDVASTSATPGATIVTRELATSYRFEWGPDANYGSSVPVPDGTVSGDTVTQPLTGLRPHRTYHFRVVAAHEDGHEVLGADHAFTTTSVAPTSVAPRRYPRPSRAGRRARTLGERPLAVAGRPRPSTTLGVTGAGG